MQGIYEELAQPDASVAGMTQNSMGARPAAEWSLKISPQCVLLRSAASLLCSDKQLVRLCAQGVSQGLHDRSCHVR